MARFLSTEWVAAFNEALEGLDAGSADSLASIVAASGAFSVLQIVHDTPEGEEIGLLLVVDGTTLRLERTDEPSTARANVTVSLSYADATALSTGEFNPAAALSAGAV